METVEKSIEVRAPLSTVYNQWTQFEEFPKFMEGVREVRQLDQKRLYWRAELFGKETEWEAEIMEQVPDHRIAWRSITGQSNAGAVWFEPLSSTLTLVTLSLSYQPSGAIEKIGDALGLVSARIDGDLKRFRDFIEKRQVETGSWRGEIRE